ncbi:Uncharacterized protein CLAVI_000213 [Candidatus Clavichlamydia salmonicola]|uniref:OmpA family protein n=1 Tax=Candidatus Clavichlamydia salmonicola TaxID=469812 RepID=UPI00189195FF|nr:OmpA family protein [Candidatus Clavichlamydia salmonicola]MBF5050602.1 Uncharacterized protein [Candidatus Clavichlamydia salmonicola]
MKILKIICLLCLSLFFTSCQRSNKQLWQDTKTCGHYVGKGFSCLLGNADKPSRKALKKRSRYGGFVALKEDAGEPLVLTSTSGHISSSLLREEEEMDPQTFATPTGKIGSILKKVHFPTNVYTITKAEDLQNLKEIARMLHKNPHIKLFIEGHTDARGTNAYNLSLGSKRANSVKNFLVQQGVNPDRLFTVSYGKEKPLVQGHSEDAWGKNRRSEFKIYNR